MIYLIESPNYYKIGYTDNVERRLKQYKTHCLEINLLDFKEGTSTDETNLHKACSEFKVENEWFRKDPEILKIWDTYFKYFQKTYPKIPKKFTPQPIKCEKDGNFKLTLTSTRCDQLTGHIRDTLFLSGAEYPDLKDFCYYKFTLSLTGKLRGLKDKEWSTIEIVEEADWDTYKHIINNYRIK